MKTCPRCKEEKDLSLFSPCTKDGKKLHTYCKKCRNAQVRESCRKNPKKYNDAASRWREDNPKKRLLTATRQSSKLKGLEHNIDENDFLLPEFCPLLGIKIDYSAGNGKTMEKPSIDRIDSTKGYIKGNVELISSLANTMKSKATPEQLLFFGRELVRRYG